VEQVHERGDEAGTYQELSSREFPFFRGGEDVKQRMNENLVKIAELLSDGQYHDGTSIADTPHR